MKIHELLNPNVMIFDLKSQNKNDAISEMVQKLADEKIINDPKVFEEAIQKREQQTSTGLGDGIAIPHAKSQTVNKPTVLFAKSLKGIDYQSLDNQPTFLFFMIAVPDNDNNTHLQALANLSKLLMQQTFTNQLKEQNNSTEVIKLFKEFEEKQDTQLLSNQDQGAFFVAVTACPTGIAHTYMAEQALYEAAQNNNVSIKVETNGAEGIKNQLTPEEINKAKAVIIAADKQVEMARFDNKPVLIVPVADGVKKADQLIKQIITSQPPIYHSDTQEQNINKNNNKTSIGQTLYKHLMNGVSNMLPFIIGGGIMIALSFLIDQTLVVPKNHLSDLGHYHKVAQYFNDIGNQAFAFMLPILAGFIAKSIASQPGLVAGFVAGSLANVGGAGFLGALVSGFMAGYIVNGIKITFKKLPNSLEGIRSILIYPLFGVLITGFATLLLNIPMKAINIGLNNFLDSLHGTSAVLLGILLASMMAFDLGGPVNKAAYVFATGTLTTAALANHGSIMMAATMAGGMIPPLAIFFATIFFKNKFTTDEKNAGLSNIVMGLSFVTEGAIPFAAKDPFRVIPSFMIGSAISGGLIGLSAIKLMAPHGGIFVIMLSSNPLLYILYILIGSIISGLILGFLKK